MNKRVIFLGLILIGLIGYKTLVPHYWYIKGKTCYDKKQISCATENLAKAYSSMPYNKDYEYYYAKALAKSKPVYNIQKAVFNLSKHAKSESAKNVARSTANLWKASTFASAGSNYIEQTPSDTNIIRWNKESFPLGVYITKTTSVPDYYDTAIRRTLALWAKSVDFIEFKTVTKKSDAQIVIEIKPMPSNVCNGNVCKYVVGFTNPSISGNLLKQMVIVLYDKNPNGTYFSDKEIYNTISHEMGHALGIMGHSYNSDDLMYPTQSETNDIYEKYRGDFHTLSGRDINTIILLYRLEPTITDKQPKKQSVLYTPLILGDKEDIAKRKLEEAKIYIQASPEIASGYIDLAGAYAEMGKYKQAEEALLKGVGVAKSNDEKFILYYNLALVSYRAKKYNAAQNYINQAKQINNSPEIIELENIIQNRNKLPF